MPEHVEVTSSLRRRFERVFQSAAFARSERLSALLEYLLQAAESPESLTVDERNIGIQLFQRPLDWDPGIDPCVRVAMSRLRNKLEVYYQGAGGKDHEKIIVAKGSYLPRIVSNSAASFLPIGTEPLKSSSMTEIRSGPGWLGPLLLSGSIVFAAVIVWLWLGRSNPATFVITPFSTELGVQFSPAIAPDRGSIAYAWDGNRGDFHIYWRAIDGGAATQLTHDQANDFYPAFSPDGTRLAFLRNDGWVGKLIVIPVHGGPEHVVATITTAPGQWTEDCGPLLGNVGPVWSRDGQELIAFDQGRFGIYAISLTSGNRRQLTSDTDTTRDFYPMPSPDGQSLAYVHYVSHGVGDLFVVRMTPGAEPRQITRDRATIRGVSWAPDGKSVVFASNRTGPYELWRVNVRSARIQPVPADSSEAANPVVAPGGTWIAFNNFHVSNSVKIADLPDQDRLLQMQTVAPSLGRNQEAALSFDGKTLLFISDRSGSWQIWRSGPDGSEPIQLTHLRGSYVGSVHWSPDNRHIVFDARPQGHSAIYLLDVETGESKALSIGDMEERAPSWSPDGKQIYFSSDREGDTSLYGMEVASGNVTLIARGGFRAEATEDKRWLYFSTLYAVLWRVPLDGGEPELLPQTLQPYSSRNWTVSGDNLLVLRKRADNRAFELWQADEHLYGRRIGQIDDDPGGEVIGINATPNGRSLLIDTRDGVSSDIVLRKADRE